jgi:uncharacterized protein
MIISLLIGLLAPITIAVGLLLFRNAYLTFLLYQGFYCLGIPVIDLVFIKKIKFDAIKKKIGFNYNKNSILLGLCSGLIFFSAIMVFFTSLRNLLIRTEDIIRLLQTWRIGENQVFQLLSIMIFTNSIVEEMFWRGYLFEKMMRTLSIQATVTVTAIFYASYHFITTVSLFNLKIGLFFTGVIFLAGIFWGFLRIKCKSIIGPMIGHFMADAAIMINYLIHVHHRISG